MTETRFYQLSVALPLVLPIIGGLALRCAQVVGLNGRLISDAGELMAWSLVFGGTPYVIVAAIILWRLRNQPVEAYYTTSLLVPILFALLLFGLFAFSALLANPDWKSAVGFAGTMAVWTLGFGYFYISVVHGIRIVLRSCHVFQISAELWPQV
jgi:hypothetical protein